MYIINFAITITWVLAPTASPLLATAFDIRFFPADLAGTYTDAAIVNYVAPTAEFAGSLQYVFTPTEVGRYKIFLTTGASTSYTIIDKKDFWVFAASPTTQPVTEVLGNNPIIPV